jgi:glutaconate CoA-transferase subunit B
VTNLAVLGFDEQTRDMTLVSVHPGVDPKAVIDNTGFDLVMPHTFPTTPPPTQLQVKLLRHKIDPGDTRKLPFREK